jgi:hypothetical protein
MRFLNADTRLNFALIPLVPHPRSKANPPWL